METWSSIIYYAIPCNELMGYFDRAKDTNSIFWRNYLNWWSIQLIRMVKEVDLSWHFIWKESQSSWPFCSFGRCSTKTWIKVKNIFVLFCVFLIGKIIIKEDRNKKKFRDDHVLQHCSECYMSIKKVDICEISI